MRPDSVPAALKPTRSGSGPADLTSLPGVGPARAAALGRLGVDSVEGLLRLVPRRLELEGRRCTTVEAARSLAQPGQGEPAALAVVGTLRGLRLFRSGRRRSVLALDLVDEHGSLRVLFFNQPWLFERLRALAAAGTRVEFSGRMGQARGTPALLAPRLSEDPPEESEPRLVPVYPTTAGIGQELLRRLLGFVLEDARYGVPEPLSPETLAEHDLPSLDEAFRTLHRPDSRAAFRRARRRLALERLLALQARLAASEQAAAPASARALRISDGELRALLEPFPFTPTAGQRLVLREILADLGRTRPMRRLLQGEVGAGKTFVALAACAAVARAGGQAALLAPTELLAEQHALGLGPLLERLGLRAVRLTGSLGARERRAALAQLASGDARLAIGTHALFSPEVAFERLDLCVIDEQQRFGVAQKQALLEKGAAVHTLLMTATPIPRTLALCYYGDLETSRLRELPPGRRPVQTRLLGSAQREQALSFLRTRLAAGERGFWVVPRIEDGAGDDEEAPATRASAERAFRELSSGRLAVEAPELLHGRLRPERRARAIERFRSGAARLLVATTMVEVGVDVPEATVMVIDGAERFGLAQLHQLRGRVGRSARPSWCLLLAPDEAHERLRVLVDSSDGFALADEDLRRRGMGDLAGLRQAGENLEGLEDPVLDLELVRSARALVRSDPSLLRHYQGSAAAAALV